jgi:hypothetical protein
MDYDLQVQQAVDDIHGILRHLEHRGAAFGRSAEQAKRIGLHLRSVDQVLGVLFPAQG